MKRKISDITVPGGRRSIDPEKVAGLAASIGRIGLLNPITIDKHDTLIAGAHRLVAHELLGLDEIECIVLEGDDLQSELAEIDENLIRNDLDPIGIGEHAIRRDELLDAFGLRAKSGGTGANQHQSRCAESASLQTTHDIANEIGISKRVLQENKQLACDLTATAKEAVRRVAATKQDALRLARKTHEEQESIVQRILDGRETTVVDAIREFTRDKLRANLEDIATQKVKEIEGVYDVIVVDPAWDQGLFILDATPESVGLNYPTMSEEELLELKIPAADNCHLWLWTTHRFLPSALRVLEAWEFKYVCTFVWHKRSGFQPLQLPKYNCEFVLYARKGNPLFVDTKNFFTCFDAPTREHSEKPEEFYDVIRRVTAGRRLDMFNRRKIEGFDGWGNEAK